MRYLLKLLVQPTLYPQPETNYVPQDQGFIRSRRELVNEEAELLAHQD